MEDMLAGRWSVGVPAAVLSLISNIVIFEELSIEFFGPLPVDDVCNLFNFNAVCSTTHYCQ